MKIISFIGNYLLLPKKQKLDIIDHRIEIFWPEKSSIEVRWDVETTGNKLIFRIFSGVRVTDIRVFFSILAYMIVQLKPLLNRLRIKDKSLFPTYHALSSYLLSLTYLSDTLLQGYTNENLSRMPSYIIKALNSYILDDIKKLSIDRRIQLLLEELGKRIWNVIDFIKRNNDSLLMIEYYIPVEILDFPKKWLRKINELCLAVLKHKNIIFLSVPDEQCNLHISEVITTILLNSMQLDFYRDILAMAYLEKKDTFTQLDIIHFKYGYNVYQSIELSAAKRLSELTELGLLEKIDDSTYRIKDYFCL
ncbi:MAG: hypothetical protein ACP6IU_10015 [Candidatus Asgardarchaeia archaeon]